MTDYQEDLLDDEVPDGDSSVAVLELDDPGLPNDDPALPYDAPVVIQTHSHLSDEEA